MQQATRIVGNQKIGVSLEGRPTLDFTHCCRNHREFYGKSGLLKAPGKKCESLRHTIRKVSRPLRHFFNLSTTRTATSRASFQQPVLNAGCPQQTIDSSKSTLWPSFSKIRTMLIPTDGTSASMKHGMKSVISTAEKPR